ncbi:MAG: hypothetical protein MUC50_02965 [Myxococcota bacterium]|jgi:hypothetical protein|nr:hypothetical protein [Myxococcota bacterium]
MDIAVTVAIVSVGVAGLTAVLGIWIERDRAKPPRYAYALSMLIMLATVGCIFQTWLDAKASEKMEEDMARMLQTLDKLATESDDPTLKQFVNTEMAVQSRSNSAVIEKLAQRVTDEGGDPAAVIGKHLPASEVNRMARTGKLKTEKPQIALPKTAAVPSVDASGEGIAAPLKISIGALGKPGDHSGTDSAAAPAGKPMDLKLPGLVLGAAGAAPASSDRDKTSGTGVVLGGAPSGKRPEGAKTREAPATTKKMGKRGDKKKGGLGSIKL